jgi:ParB family chromosome partitioning protein
MKRSGLGNNGKNILLDLVNQTKPPQVHVATGLVVQMLPVTAIVPSSFQPRRHFAEDAMQELANSIREQGILQPLLVRAVGVDRYELVAGERRWRAAKMLNLEKVPAIVHVVDNRAAAAMALIENIQRQDLTPLEEAEAFQRLIKDFSLTHEALATILGRSRSAITNVLRLLGLSEVPRELLSAGKLGMGHARALLPLTAEQQAALAQVIVEQDLTAREVERRVRQLIESPDVSPTGKSTAKISAQSLDADTLRLQQQLSERLGALVKIQTVGKKGQGKLVIHYQNLDELQGILEYLQVTNDIA